MKPLCVVFADAFAYSTYIKLGGIGSDFSVQKIKPGIAYSSNLHYLLFDGQTPDDVGFFTDYCWKSAKYINPGIIKKNFDQIDTLNNFYRALVRKITKKRIIFHLERKLSLNVKENINLCNLVNVLYLDRKL